MGLVRLFCETVRIMTASDKKSFQLCGHQPADVFIILELFESLLEYFASTPQADVYNRCDAGVHLARVMITLYRQQSPPLLIMSLAFVALVLGPVRTLAIIYSPMERTMESALRSTAPTRLVSPGRLATTGTIHVLPFLPH